MPAFASLPFTDQRQSVRHPIDHAVIAEHPRTGDLALRMVNISPEGFMAVGAERLSRGERLLLRLPVIGQIDAHLIWHSTPRAGFRFERLLRLGDFTRLLLAVEPMRRTRAND